MIQTSTTHWSTKYLGRGWNPPQFDCWMLVVMAYAEIGVELPVFDVDASDIRSVRATFRTTGEFSNWYEVSVGSLVEYDVVLMSIGNMPVHAGVFVGDGKAFRVLHCAPMGGTGIDNLGSLQSRGYKVASCYRRIGVGLPNGYPNLQKPV